MPAKRDYRDLYLYIYIYIYIYLYLRSGGAGSWDARLPRNRFPPSSITGPPPQGGPVGSPGAQGGFPWGPKSAFGGLFDLVYIYMYYMCIIYVLYMYYIICII